MPGPDVERALQAQDLQRYRLTYEGEPTISASKRFSRYSTVVHPPGDGNDRRASQTQRESGARGWLVSVFHDNAGVVDLRRSKCISSTRSKLTTPLPRSTPTAVRSPGIVGSQPRPVRHGARVRPAGQRLGLLLRLTVPSTAALPDGLVAPAPDSRRGTPGSHRRRQPVRRALRPRLGTVRCVATSANRWCFAAPIGALPVDRGRPTRRGEDVPDPGDHIVMVGGRIGADGIHGATFSSGVLDESAPVQAVQIGDPITQKKNVRLPAGSAPGSRPVLNRLRTMGPADSRPRRSARWREGSGRRAARSDAGATQVRRDSLRGRFSISEAQERMTLAVPPDQIGTFSPNSRARREC